MGGGEGDDYASETVLSLAQSAPRQKREASTAHLTGTVLGTGRLGLPQPGVVLCRRFQATSTESARECQSSYTSEGWMPAAQQIASTMYSPKDSL